VEIRATKDNEELLESWRARGIRFVLLNLQELSLYEEAYFRPRFTEAEWARFESLRESLIPLRIFPPDGWTFVARLPELPAE
jgi:hypothetical protein